MTCTPQEVSSLTQARDLLIQQKLEIQTKLDGMQGESGRLQEQLDRVQQEADDVQQMLRRDNSGLQDKLVCK